MNTTAAALTLRGLWLFSRHNHCHYPQRSPFRVSSLTHHNPIPTNGARRPPNAAQLPSWHHLRVLHVLD